MPLAATPEPLPHWPALGVCRAPYQVFTDQAVYDREPERIFRGDVWHWVGLEAETPNPGDFKTNVIGGTGRAFHTPHEHLDALRRFKHEVGL
jgi:anthranilate 1,2-dioxygenase large subunit